MKKNPTPSQDRLLELFTYDAETGQLAWADDFGAGGKRRKGRPAGFLAPNGYIRVKVDGKPYLAHRVIWKMLHGIDAPDTIDHINRDRADNRLANLRTAAHVDNVRSRSIYSKHSNTGYLGVCYLAAAGRYVATLWHQGTTYYLGRHKAIAGALAARRAKEAELYHPDFRPSD